MKKIFLIIATVLILSQNVMAELVKPDLAAKYAQKVLRMKQSPVLETMPSLRAQSRDAKSADPEYYIFNNPQGGWVIIAADDRVNPVIAYSNQGSFSTTSMPDNLKWWMDGVAQVVNDVRVKDLPVSESVRNAWNALAAGKEMITEGTTKYTETALWNQGEPFNNLCPVITGENERAVSGCVATAMAIIMQYNSWPEHGKGVIGGYSTRSSAYIPAYDISSHYYDWELMSDEAVVKGQTGTWNFEQKESVAQLIHDCGVAVQMEYSSEGSGTSDSRMIYAMQEHMSYSANSSLISRSSYSLDEWYALIKNEIDNGRLVYYSGQGNAGGHAFVCDGYDTEGSKLRINWGWGGSANGYYTLDLSVESAGFNFSNEQSAVIGLAPDTTSVEAVKNLGFYLCYNNGFYGMEPLVPADINLGGELSFYVGWISSLSARDLVLDFKVCLEDKDGNVRQEGWPLHMEIPSGKGFIYANQTEMTTLTVAPDLTDHFRLYVKNGEDWVPMVGNNDLLPQVDGVICGVIQDPVIIVPDDCAAGKTIDLSLTLGFTHVAEVKWTVNGEALQANQVQLVKGKNVIRADVKYLDETSGSIFRTVTLE